MNWAHQTKPRREIGKGGMSFSAIQAEAKLEKNPGPLSPNCVFMYYKPRYPATISLQVMRETTKDRNLNPVQTICSFTTSVTLKQRFTEACSSTTALLNVDDPHSNEANTILGGRRPPPRNVNSLTTALLNLDDPHPNQAHTTLGGGIRTVLS